MKRKLKFVMIVLFLIIICIFMAIKDLTPKLKTKLKTAEQEFRQEYSPDLPFGQNIGGMQMYSMAFKRGYGEEVIAMDENGLWMGAADFENAKTRFDYAGNGVFTGRVKAGSFITGLDNGVTVGNNSDVDEFTDIQEAIDYINDLGGGNVFIKAGTYTIDSDITLYSGINLVGEDPDTTILDFNGSNKMVVINDETNIEIKKILFTGFRYTSRSVPGGYSPVGAILITHTNGSGLLSDNILINGCKFTDNYNSSTWAAAPHYSISATYAGGVVIENNIFDDTVGIGAYGNVMKITNNAFSNIVKEAIYLNTVGGKINLNTFDGCRGEIIKSQDDVENIIITDNIISNHHGPGFVFSSGLDYIVIANNSIGGSTSSTYGMNLGTNSNYITITGNVIRNFNNDGILINGNALYINITGNSITDNGGWGVQTGNGPGAGAVVVANVLSSNTSGACNSLGSDIVQHNMV